MKIELDFDLYFILGFLLDCGLCLILGFLLDENVIFCFFFLCFIFFILGDNFGLDIFGFWGFIWRVIFDFLGCVGFFGLGGGGVGVFDVVFKVKDVIDSLLLGK